VCEQDQPLDGFALMFHSFDAERLKRIQEGQLFASGTLHMSGELTTLVIDEIGPSGGAQ
jgi:hypothetical protein